MNEQELDGLKQQVEELQLQVWMLTQGDSLLKNVRTRPFSHEVSPVDVDYLVGTANATLASEIVVGATPGGELGNTWASPTVDATHSGSTHAATQAAAEATAAAALAAQTIADHDTTATGAELETLTDGSTAGGLHVHVEAEITDLDHLTGAEAIAAVEGEATLDLTGDVTIAAAKSLAVDTIGEKTGAAGVTIDGVLLKDSKVYPVADDANMYFGKIGSNFFLQADTGDFIHYNVGLNKWYFYIGTAQKFTIDASAISAKSKPIQDVTDPTNAQDAATKKYVDDTAGGGGASTALDNLAAVAINTSLISDADSTDDFGSAAKYWANAYIDKLYLNATATLDGATAGRVNLTGNLQVAGLIGVGTAPVAGTYLKIVPTGDVSGQKGIDIAPASATIGDGGHFYALTGTAVISTVAPNVGTEMDGLFFSAIKGGTGDLTEMSAIRVGVGQLGSAGAITRMHGILVDSRFDSGGTPTITDAWGVRIRNQGTDHVTNAYGLMVEPMVGAGSNYSIWAGANAAGTPRLRLDDGTPAANQTMLYLAEGITPTIRRVQWMDPGAGGVNFVGGERVMVLV